MKRYEAAFAVSGMEFLKTRPARLLLTKIATDPAAIMTAETSDRFGRLFARIAEAHASNERRGAEPVR